MIFGQVPLTQARGGILAHSLRVEDRVLRKGALIDSTAFALLRAAGYEEVTIARLEPGDMPEGDAAAHLGENLIGPGIRRSQDVHGRVNLFAESRGLLRLDASGIERLNRIDEAVTLATLPDRTVVEKDDLLATLKIIPFAVSAATISAAETLLRQGSLLAVKPFLGLSAGLILTKLPQLKDTVIAGTVEATRARIAAYGGTMLSPRETPHETPPLVEAINALLAEGANMILISGASAVTDRLDVVPQAIIQAGGRITRFGMPVDPGNLICLGMIGSTKPVIVMPGCARSPKLNGVDWVLNRLFAGEAVDSTDFAAMGVGGLLQEIETRPLPRDAKTPAGFGASPHALPRIAALVLAAGQSKRMGATNKLLVKLPNGKTMIAQIVDHVTSCAASPVIVVTGHQEADIRRALAGKPVRFVTADDHAEGIAASLRAGIAALSSEIGAALICLGDMPLVDPAVLSAILAAYNPAEGREIVIPSFGGQRGNPVLWGKRFFPELLQLSGDVGARQILHRHMEVVAEVPVETDSVLRDFDTHEMLASLS